MEFINLKKQYKSLKNQIDKGIHDVLDHGQYIMGPEIPILEKNLTKFVNTKHSITCSSGTDAVRFDYIRSNRRSSVQMKVRRDRPARRS